MLAGGRRKCTTSASLFALQTSMELPLACLPEALADADTFASTWKEVLASRRRLQTEFDS